MGKRRKVKTKKDLIWEQLDRRKTPDPDGKRRYAPRVTGKKFGLGICQFWALLFERNELAPRHEKMTDEEIKRQVILEYPDRRAVKRLGPVGMKGEVTVNYYRHLYNIGRLTRDDVPEIQSRRYDEHGRVVNPRTGKCS